ncbi:hypothetical protein V0U79_02665 [Hyphobacterium sp. HN65]|uniref:Uncharacterized protein n=1 Tax=Hyphobacterium lacteum TaxID=3116575 RepID=A0ABU7LMZ6_9PROT|nr:hypothetical protein [Hyphobacterium sp. HN65]MEE2525252.1 hypothetical protein [Hyphobacterium sp. HN65]
MRNLLLCSTILLGLAACSAPEAADEAMDEAAENAAGTPAEDTAQADTGDDDAAGLPDTDIAVARISWTDGMPEITTPVVVTMQGLYDNQPAYDAAGGFYFTTESADGNTDIRYMDRSGSVSVITNTPGESEYSPRPSPDGRSVTYIHQPPGQVGGQAWRLMLDGSNYGPIHGYGPAGYYALSGDQTQMLLFALTDPFSLLWLDLENGIEGEITTGIGRALYSAPDGQSAYFTLQNEDGSWTIHSFSFEGNGVGEVMELPGETEDYAVFTTPAGELGWFASWDGELLFATGMDGNWRPVANLSGLGDGGVSRLAVAADADHMAIVFTE